MNRREILKLAITAPIAAMVAKIFGGCGGEDFQEILSISAVEGESVLSATERHLQNSDSLRFTNYESNRVDSPEGDFVRMMCLGEKGWIGGDWVFTVNGRRYDASGNHAGNVMVSPGDEVVWLHRY